LALAVLVQATDVGHEPEAVGVEGAIAHDVQILAEPLLGGLHGRHRLIELGRRPGRRRVAKRPIGLEESRARAVGVRATHQRPVVHPGGDVAEELVAPDGVDPERERGQAPRQQSRQQLAAHVHERT